MIAQISADAFTPYDRPHGKGKGHPVVPEVQAYGMVLVLLCFLVLVVKKYRSRP
jgi:hypothetical protein